MPVSDDPTPVPVVTVNVELAETGPYELFMVAVMVVLPVFIPVATPETLTVATFVLLDTHVT